MRYTAFVMIKVRVGGTELNNQQPFKVIKCLTEKYLH